MSDEVLGQSWTYLGEMSGDRRVWRDEDGNHHIEIPAIFRVNMTHPDIPEDAVYAILPREVAWKTDDIDYIPLYLGQHPQYGSMVGDMVVDEWETLRDSSRPATPDEIAFLRGQYAQAWDDVLCERDFPITEDDRNRRAKSAQWCRDWDDFLWTDEGKDFLRGVEEKNGVQFPDEAPHRAGAAFSEITPEDFGA